MRLERVGQALRRNQDLVWIAGGFMTVMAALAYQDVTVVLTWVVTLILVAWRVNVRVAARQATRRTSGPDDGGRRIAQWQKRVAVGGVALFMLAIWGLAVAGHGSDSRNLLMIQLVLYSPLVALVAAGLWADANGNTPRD